MIILGIDPGLADTGWAIIKKEKPLKLISYGCIKTKKEENFAKRLGLIHNKINELIKDYKPDQLAIEEIFFAKNAKTAIKIAQVTGVVKFTGQDCNLDVFEYTPLNVKMTITGYGRADKKQIQVMVSKLLNLKDKITPSHAADAVAVCLTHLNTNHKLKP